MRKLTLAAVVVLAGLAFSGSAAAPQNLGVARFRETPITRATNGDHAGAVDVWRTRVWLLKKPQTVGTGAITCIRVDAHTYIRECQGTYILPRGRIQVAGEIITRAAFQLTVVGGTGVYISIGGVAVFSGLTSGIGIVTLYLE